MKKCICLLLCLILMLSMLPTALAESSGGETYAVSSSAADDYAAYPQDADANADTGMGIYYDMSRNWMTFVDGSLQLGQFTIPGTHDSAARACSMGKCQYHDIPWQIEHGIRFIDARLGLNYAEDQDGREVLLDETLRFFHSDYDCKVEFGSILVYIRRFFQANPGECIVMSIKNDRRASMVNGVSFEGLLEHYIAQQGDIFYTENRVPTLDEVRGKIVLVRRYASDRNPAIGIDARKVWGDDTYFSGNFNGTQTLCGQDCYKFGGRNAESDKWHCVQKQDSIIQSRLANGGVNQLWINFASGVDYSHAFDTNAIGRYVDAKLRDEMFANTMYKGQKHGIIPMDWVEPPEIQKMYMSNVLERDIYLKLTVNGGDLPSDARVTLHSQYHSYRVYTLEKVHGAVGEYKCRVHAAEMLLRLRINGVDCGAVTVDYTTGRIPDVRCYQPIYDLNGGTGTAPVDNKIYHSGDTVNVLQTDTPPTRDGFVFRGWALAGSTTPITSFKIDESHYTLRALWMSTTSVVNINDPRGYLNFIELKEENGNNYYRTSALEGHAEFIEYSGALTVYGTITAAEDRAFYIEAISGNHTIILGTDTQSLSLNCVSAFGEPDAMIRADAQAELSLVAGSKDCLISNKTGSAVQVNSSLSLSAIDYGTSAPGLVTFTGSGSNPGIALSGVAQGGTAGSLTMVSGRFKSNGVTGIGSVTVYGGTLDASGSTVGGDNVNVTINGGSVAGEVLNAHNVNGDALGKVTLHIETGANALAVDAISPEYGTEDLYSVNGGIYFRLPASVAQLRLQSGESYYAEAATLGERDFVKLPISVDAYNQRIFANGTHIIIDKAAGGEGTVICRDDNTPIPIFGADGSTSAGYDLTGWSVFGGSMSAAVTTGSCQIDMNDGDVFKLYAGALDKAVSVASNVNISGGRVYGVYGAPTFAGYATDASSTDVKTTIHISGEPELSDTEIFAIENPDEHDTVRNVFRVEFANTGTADEPAELAAMGAKRALGDSSYTDLCQLSLSSSHISLAGETVDMTDTVMLSNVDILNLPQNSSLHLDDECTNDKSAEVKSVNAGGSVFLTEGAYLNVTGNINSGRINFDVDENAAEDALLLKYKDGASEAKLSVSGSRTIYVEQNGTVYDYRLSPVVVDTVNKKLFAMGAGISIVDGANANTTLIKLQNGNKTITLSGVGGSTSAGYDLSQYTVYGGAHNAFSTGNSIVMSGGKIKNLVGGGLNGKTHGGALLEISGGTVSGDIYLAEEPASTGSMTGEAELLLSSGVGNPLPFSGEVYGNYSTNGTKVVDGGCTVNFGVCGSESSPAALPKCEYIDSLVIDNALTYVKTAANTFGSSPNIALSLLGGSLTLAESASLGSLVGGSETSRGELVFPHGKTLTLSGDVVGLTGVTPGDGSQFGDTVIISAKAALSNFVSTRWGTDIMKDGNSFKLVESEHERLLYVMQSTVAPDSSVVNGISFSDLAGFAWNNRQTVGIVTDWQFKTLPEGKTATATLGVSRWTVESDSYDENEIAPQTAQLTAAAIIPDGSQLERGGASLEALLTVDVPAAVVLQKNPADPDNPEQITGLAENQSVENGTRLRILVERWTSDGGTLSYVPIYWKTNPSGGFTYLAGKTYAADVNTAGMSNGSHVFSVYYRQFDASAKATGAVVMTDIDFTVTPRRSKPDRPNPSTNA